MELETSFLYSDSLIIILSNLKSNLFLGVEIELVLGVFMLMCCGSEVTMPSGLPSSSISLTEARLISSFIRVLSLVVLILAHLPVYLHKKDG